MPSYYPRTTDGRADWWQNIQANGTAALTTLGFETEDITPIIDDAKWAIHALRTLRVTFENYHESLIAYAQQLMDGTEGEAPAIPVPPTLPTAPTPVVDTGIEARREKWVQVVKNSPGYNDSIGESLGLVAPSTPFDPSAYTPTLTSPTSPNPKTFAAKFRKASGNVDGVAVYGSKGGSDSWVELGRFNSTPFSANVPTTATTPELWQFRIRAFKKDQFFGNYSDIVELVILP